MLFMIGTYVFTKVGVDKKIVDLGTNETVTIICDLVDPPKPVDPPRHPSGGQRTNAVATVINERDTTAEVPLVNNNLPINNNPNGNPNATGTLTGTGVGTVATTFTTEIIEPPTAIPVEEPEFEGGLKAIREFIQKNTVYPELAKEIGKEGTVYISFIIDEKGQIESSKVLKGIGGGCDEEASRVVNKLPKFKKPGKNALGKPVKVVFNIPIAFRLK